MISKSDRGVSRSLARATALHEGSHVTAHNFDDSEAYEQFMGPWSRQIGEAFLAWLQPPIGAHWLEVGCGTGIFTAVIEGTCAPATVVGIDPAEVTNRSCSSASENNEKQSSGSVTHKICRSRAHRSTCLPHPWF